MNKSKRSSREYERLGKMLVDIYETGYVGRGELYKMSFIKGILTGLGSVLGATVVIALLAWLLTLFAHISLIKPFVDPLRNTVQPQENK